MIYFLIRTRFLNRLTYARKLKSHFSILQMGSWIKKWKAFDCVFPNSLIPFIGDYVRIICAIINAFKPARVLDSSDVSARVEAMKTRSEKINQLQKFVEDNRLSYVRERIWLKIRDARECLADFPKLSLKKLKCLTIGIYQVSVTFISFKIFCKSWLPKIHFFYYAPK